MTALDYFVSSGVIMLVLIVLCLCLIFGGRDVDSRFRVVCLDGVEYICYPYECRLIHKYDLHGKQIPCRK